MMIKSYPILPICSMLVMGCDELGLKLPSDKEEARLASIEHKIKEGEVRLNLINRKLEEEQKKLEEARAEVEFQRCRSKSSAIRAEVERLRAECARKIATHNICLAKQSEGKAEAGIGGCLLGIAAASVSMGAAAPWALGGCTVGLAVGNAIAEACPVPNCAGSLENAERKVLLERNIDTMPRCGGWLGIKVNPVEHEISGVRIKKVTSGTYAANIGLVAGDIITELAGSRVYTIDDINPVLEHVALGVPLQISVIRNKIWFNFNGLSASRDAQGRNSNNVSLGVYMENAASARLQQGVVITSIVHQSPASQNLTPGEIITSVKVPSDTNEPNNFFQINYPSDLESILDEVRPHAEISISTINRNTVQTKTIRLAERQNQEEL